MNVQHQRKGARAFGHAQFAELIGVRAVGQAGVGWGRRERQDVVCWHGRGHKPDSGLVYGFSSQL